MFFTIKELLTSKLLFGIIFFCLNPLVVIWIIFRPIGIWNNKVKLGNCSSTARVIQKKNRSLRSSIAKVCLALYNESPFHTVAEHHFLTNILIFQIIIFGVKIENCPNRKIIDYQFFELDIEFCLSVLTVLSSVAALKSCFMSTSCKMTISQRYCGSTISVQNQLTFDNWKM